MNDITIQSDREPHGETPLPKLQQVLTLLDRVRDAPNSEHIVFQSTGEFGDSTRQREATTHTLPENIGRFEVRRQLGEGGYGIVLLAFDPRLKREVALKIPRAGTLLTPELQARFLNEGEAAAALSHPNIIPVFEAGTAGPIHFITSRYCEGQSLAEWMVSNGGPAEPDDACRLVSVLAESMQHAHDRGVLHRDLKPANVLLEYCEDGPKNPSTLDAAAARITDFGLARIDGIENDLTRTGSILGTPSYMSPEQAEGRHDDVGPATDIYSLGAILYELLTGKPPFHGRNLLDTLQAVRGEDPRSPSREVKAVPRDLAAICLKCLEKKTADRYESAFALHQDLNRFLLGETVHARPATRLERLLRWGKRNPRVAFLATTSFALLLCLAAGSTMAAMLLAQSNRESLDNLEDAIAAETDAKSKETLALKAVFEARVSQSKASRTSGRVGQREDSIQAISKAVGLIGRLNYGDDERRDLRNQAIASLTLVDMQLDQQWPLDNFGHHAFATSPDGQLYAACEKSAITIRRIADNSEVTRFKPAGIGKHRVKPTFSPGGKFIAGRFTDTELKRHLSVWNLKTGELVLQRSIRSNPSQIFDFSSDDRRIAVVRSDSTIEILTTLDFETHTTLADQPDVRAIKIDRSGNRLALFRDQQIEIRQIDSNEVLQTIESGSPFHPLDVLASDFSPNGELIAAACFDRIVRVWRIADGHIVARLRGHGSEATQVVFHPGGQFLATGSYDHTTRIWQVDGWQQNLQAPESCTTFSQDGKWLGRPGGRWRFLDPNEFRRRSYHSWTDIHPSGLFGVCRSDSEKRPLHIVETVTGREAPVSVGAGHALFTPDGKNLIVIESNAQDRYCTIFRFPIVVVDATSSGQPTTNIRIGPPTKLARLRGGIPAFSTGKTKLAIGQRRSGKLMVLDLETGQLQTMEGLHGGSAWVDLSADETSIASGTRHGRNVRIWNTQTGKREADFPSGSSTVSFHPREQLLVSGDGNAFFFRSLNSESVHRLPALKSSGDWPGRIGFSPNGEIAALAYDQRTVRVHDTKTRKELASFDFNLNDEIDALRFSTDLKTMLVSARQSNYIWHLDRLRKRLQTMDLDWIDSTTPSGQQVADNPQSSAQPQQIHFDIDAGSSGEDATGPSKYSASSEYSTSFAADHAFDGFEGSRWHSAKKDTIGAWVAVEWERARTIKSLTLHEYHLQITGLQIQKQTSENSDWTTVVTVEGEALSQLIEEEPRPASDSGQKKTKSLPTRRFRIPLPAAIELTGVRIVVTQTIEKTRNTISIRDVEFE